MNRNFLIVLLTAFALAQDGQAGVRSELRQGQQAYAGGDFPASSGYFGEALAQEPDNPEAHFNLGASSYRQGDLDAAASRFARVAEQADPQWSAKGWYNLGNTRLQQQDPAGAVEAYVQALKKNPGLEEARWNLELALRQLQQQQQQQQSGGDSEEQQDGEKSQDSQDGSQGQSGQQEKQDGKDSQSQGQQGNQGQPEEQGSQGDSGAAKPGDPGEAQDSAAQAMPVSKEQLEQILQAIAQQEKAALQKQLQQQPTSGRRVEKDW